MKFYVTRYHQDGAKKLSWQGTQLDAAATRKGLAAAPSITDINTVEFDVPTDKPGLLAFLNEYVTGELGVEQAAELFRQMGLKMPQTP